jgi:hypothetical protein
MGSHGPDAARGSKSECAAPMHAECRRWCREAPRTCFCFCVALVHLLLLVAFLSLACLLLFLHGNCGLCNGRCLGALLLHGGCRSDLFFGSRHADLVMRCSRANMLER